jgi:hypothetical protein
VGRREGGRGRSGELRERVEGVAVVVLVTLHVPNQHQLKRESEESEQLNSSLPNNLSLLTSSQLPPN